MYAVRERKIRREWAGESKEKEERVVFRQLFIISLRQNFIPLTRQYRMICRSVLDKGGQPS